MAADKAAYDASCRRLLANRSVLAWILKGSVAEYADLDPEEIARTFIGQELQISGVPVFPDRESKTELLPEALNRDLSRVFFLQSVL